MNTVYNYLLHKLTRKILSGLLKLFKNCIIEFLVVCSMWNCNNYRGNVRGMYENVHTLLQENWTSLWTNTGENSS
jgi:hypothetical protein